MLFRDMPLAAAAQKSEHCPIEQTDATVAHALAARGELERILYCWVSAGTMRTQPSRRFLPLSPPRSTR
ncbi:hypothetical protein [Burkholderia thailandensis]|uniref:hypothetical protein n=1 Tax=Burkholderia thailandensis TaxID=57975 RepID=UPI00016A2C9B|nr:hypothetical protein [Burkholderia thailandensis]AIP62005.1 hypothetical protein DR62_2144 [Burkholderia thailandensis]AOI52565.1 hypothetical protein WI24_12685 [Burkholderia thailandensis]